MTDRITVTFSTADATLGAAVLDHQEAIATETLATEISQVDGAAGAAVEVAGTEASILIERVAPE